MINNILLAAAVSIPVTPLCAPILAEEVTSPKEIPVVSSMFSGLSNDRAPAMAVSVVNINSNITCRSKARSKYLELGARGMEESTNNYQWGIVGNMNSIVWCRENHAIISVAGDDFDAVVELKNELKGLY
jgi:hypothetical protein